MLKRLSIRNIVLIEQVDLTLDTGLTVLTGETGAGKSILLDALGLILGKRSDARLVRSGEDKATIIAEYNITHHQTILDWLREQDMDDGNHLLIRRQLKADGASRAFVNDQPVALKTLKMLGDQLVTIHGQHGQKGLMDAAQHAAILDRYGAYHEIVAQTRGDYRAFKASRQHHHTLLQQLEHYERERDYLEHVVKELDALKPQEGEAETLAHQRIELMKAEKNGRLLKEVYSSFNGAQPVSETIRQIQLTLVRSDVAQLETGQKLIDALERCMNELGDAESELNALIRDDRYDERELEQTEERLFALKDMARKHRVDADTLVTLWHSSRDKLATINHSTQALQDASHHMQMAKQTYMASATQLSDKRKQAATTLEQLLHLELTPLKMEATRFKVLIEEQNEDSWTERGIDKVTFMVSTNPGSPFGNLSSIASGGELSRFMLALAVVLATDNTQEMLIFDEIDTGTGGAVADAIGARLARLAQGAQVAVVTHQPQVAARGNTHYFIEKTLHQNSTTTHIHALDAEARHEELARMLSGARITDEARQAARQLLQDCNAA